MNIIRLTLIMTLLVAFLPVMAAAEASPFAEGAEVKIVDAVASADYIKDVDTAEAAEVEVPTGFPKKGVIACGSNLRLRSWPWGNVLSTHNPGAEVKVLGVSGEFYVVEIDGQQGYMHRNYISLPDKPASQVEPDYPGSTRSGGALELNEGVKVSKAAGAVIEKSEAATAANSTSTPTSTTAKPGVQTGANGKVNLDVPTQCQMQVKCPAPGSACGPTSLGMALAYYTKKDAGSLASSLWNICGSTAANGTGHAGLQKGASHYGYPNAKWHYTVGASWIREQVKAGRPMIAHVQGHYVCITGIDDSGNIYYNDPAKSQVKQQKSFADFSAWWTGGGSKHAVMTLE
ncbi:MAG: C39 family peptidase [Candidatus Riflebacteria bacterium]|nr:C39 family peptidase [Candidatus Riflebacteria bacterium]